ncbi:hypothetical protein WA026_012110 [Henosepilachna vigintioctopunctata]|uniref:Uncharacterized protein n=1 Tax=Henosepilachna vigintioctopunctata TaxID=420089 RepID=A0AAW1VEX6_9CUCU
MKFIFLLLTTTSLVISSSSQFVHVDDNSIVIEKENGRRISITKQYGPSGDHFMEIDIKGPNDFSKKIKILDDSHIKFSHHDESNPTTESNKMSTSNDKNVDMSRLKRSRTSGTARMNSFAQIMKDYQSVTDKDSFKNLLKKVKQSVEKDEIDSTILDYLQYLSQQKSWSHSIQSGFESPNEILRRKQSGIDGNYWHVYPYLKQNLVMSKLPTRQWYEQNMLSSRNTWQNDINLMKIKEKLWNEETPTYYQKYMNMYPVFPRFSSQFISEDSTGGASEPTNRLSGKYWVNKERTDDKLQWWRYP